MAQAVDNGKLDRKLICPLHGVIEDIYNQTSVNPKSKLMYCRACYQPLREADAPVQINKPISRIQAH